MFFMFSMSAIFHKQYITYCSADNYNDVQSVPRNTNYLGAECLHEGCLTSIADPLQGGQGDICPSEILFVLQFNSPSSISARPFCSGVQFAPFDTE